MTFVALFRGINVGGGNTLPMRDLRKLAIDLGWTAPRTYIASGNLVFEADGAPDALAATLKALIADRLRLDVAVLVLTGEALKRVLAECPYHPDDPRYVHIAFGLGAFDVDRERLAALIAPDEDLKIKGRTAYLHAPSGIGRSQLAAALDRVLGVPTTARNLRTVTTLVQMLDG